MRTHIYMFLITKICPTETINKQALSCMFRPNKRKWRTTNRKHWKNYREGERESTWRGRKKM